MAARRTKKGNVTASARKKFGAKGGSLKKGSFPVFDAKSAKSALKLRGHAPSKKAVISKVSAFASKTGNKSLKAAVSRARAADKKK